jgi:hypothetical protein
MLYNCEGIIRGFGQNDYKICKSCNNKFMKVYERHMHGWGGSSLWCKVLWKHKLLKFGMDFEQGA